MTKLGKTVFAGLGVLVIAIFIFGVLSFGRGVQNSVNNTPEENGSTPNADEELPDDLKEHILSKSDLIVVESPQPLSTITSPLTVSGEARGQWYFEADFQITLVDWDGRIIAQSFASAQLDPEDPNSTWMTTDFVPFEGSIEFENPSFPGSEDGHFSRRGTIIFQKANPSDLPENADALEIPITFERIPGQ